MTIVVENEPRSGGSSTIPFAWGAIVSLSLCAWAMTASEFMPISLLTPIAESLKVTEGRVGQATSVSGLFAVATSLLISPSTPGIDRRHVLLALTLVVIASCVTIAVAPTIEIFAVGRALIGIALGGFWSMSAATVMRLVAPAQIGKGLAILNVGNALAVTIAPPAAIFIGQYLGWRGAFLSVVPVAAVALVLQFRALPSMPSLEGIRPLNVLRVLGHPRVTLGVLAIAAFCTGRTALFTYLRPFLESVTHVDFPRLAGFLTLLGVAGLIGTSLVGFVLKDRLYSLQIAMPVVLACIALLLVALGETAPAVAVLLALWGMINGATGVVWWTWLSRVLPRDAEAGGGLLVAVIQLSSAVGSTSGGFIFDLHGHRATFTMSAAILCGSALLAFIGWRRGLRSSSPA
ncbi:MFS transporter [Phenylobacterium sp.]|uniref:MFS transporter n=1 Tax=Phenylobacterium sp. TaxID=1871053 RepID=UPI0027356C93|nr:MFS transporter [Phenylobacterium sp.]MDP3660186.1 MFS transporter [Phenylobacterium sp.]